MENSLEACISTLDFLTRGKNALLNDGAYKTVGDILKLYAEEGEHHAERVLIRIPELGKTAIDQMKKSLIEKGYSLRPAAKPKISVKTSVLRSMATAPKDGTIIMVVSGCFTSLDAVFWGEYRNGSGSGWFGVDCIECGSGYAGWMDLPEEIAERMVAARDRLDSEWQLISEQQNA